MDGQTDGALIQVLSQRDACPVRKRHKGVVIIYDRGGGGKGRGDIEFECKQLDGEQNINAQLQRGAKFECTDI